MAAIDRGGGDFAGAGVAAKREKEDYEGRKGGGVGRTNKSISDSLNQQISGTFSGGLLLWWVCEICKFDEKLTHDKRFLNAFSRSFTNAL